MFTLVDIKDRPDVAEKIPSSSKSRMAGVDDQMVIPCPPAEAVFDLNWLLPGIRSPKQPARDGEVVRVNSLQPAES